MAAKGLEMEVEVVSTETVKPSSPTPQHLLTHRLSWIDQIMPPIHICLVLFYSGDRVVPGGGGIDSTPEKLRSLKRSLSEALALYYPLAGRMDGTSPTVTCTDEGVDFIEARAGCPLSTVLFRDPETETVDRLLPCSRRCCAEGDDGPLLTVQATAFDCGGVAVGVCIHHKVADGQSLAVFLDTWAAVARGEPDAASRRPCLDTAAAAFPPVTQPELTNVQAEPKRLVTRRFVLDGSRICDLRDKGAEAPDGGAPLTRVQAVTALLWRCLIRAASTEGAAPTAREFAAVHGVNLRPLMQPPPPESAFGNIVAITTTPILTVDPSEQGSVDGRSIDPLRRLTEEHTTAAIKKVDGGYIRGTLQWPEGPSVFFRPLVENVRRGARVLYISSLWGFPFYEADFGWGPPAWVARAGIGARADSVTLMGRRDGGGHMEAWVALEAEEMARFEQDPEFASLQLSSHPFPPLPPR